MNTQTYSMSSKKIWRRWWLVAQRQSNTLVYLRGKPAQAIVYMYYTLRKKLQVKLHLTE